MTEPTRTLEPRAVLVAEALTHGPIRSVEQAQPPALPGFYAWWINSDALDEFQPAVPIACPPTAPRGFGLLYIGISPSSAEGNETIASRVDYHANGKVLRSTLRYSLASLLPRLHLRPVGTTPNGKKPELHDELALTTWIKMHLGVTWAIDEEPWQPGLESRVIHLLRPPLNGTHSKHPFRFTVKEARGALLRSARQRNARGSAPRTSTKSAGRKRLEVPPATDSKRDSGYALYSQRLTANDLSTGIVRVPRATKSVFPSEPAQVTVVLRGKTVSASWNPRVGPDRERSGVLRVGSGLLAQLVSEGAILIVSKANDGSIGLNLFG